MNLLVFLLVGAVAGWLAGQIMKGSGYGLLWNIILGIVGGIVAGWVSTNVISLNFFQGILGQIVSSAIGAVIVLFIAGLFKK